jgi:hypothetical protein
MSGAEDTGTAGAEGVLAELVATGCVLVAIVLTGAAVRCAYA